MMTVETNRNKYIWDRIVCLLFGTFGQVCLPYENYWIYVFDRE